jgi:hypothetical protein
METLARKYSRFPPEPALMSQRVRRTKIFPSFVETKMSHDGGFNLQSIKFIRPQLATNLIQAVSYNASGGIREPRTGIVGHSDDGDWIEYDQIDFGRGVSSAR